MPKQPQYPTNVDVIQLIAAPQGYELHYSDGNIIDIEDVVCFALHRNGESCALWCDAEGKLRYPNHRRNFVKCFFREPHE